MTTFQLLCKRKGDDGWREWREEAAHNAKTAIQNAYMREPSSDVIAAVAVPARSWNPQQIQAVPQPPKLVLGEPDAPALPPTVAGQDAA